MKTSKSSDSALRQTLPPSAAKHLLCQCPRIAAVSGFHLKDTINLHAQEQVLCPLPHRCYSPVRAAAAALESRRNLALKMDYNGTAGRMLKFFLLFVLALAAEAPAELPLERARDLYQHIRYQAALDLLLPLDSKDAPTLALIGKCYFRLGEFKKASDVLEDAVALDPGNSQYHHWLGKAFGRRAETSSFITAPGYASNCRRHFEKAVELDPKNLLAINDLFEYYLAAPGFLGGGSEKAAALAERIRALDPAEYHYAQAQLARKRKDLAAAEQELRRALELAPAQVGRHIDLARFLARQGRHQESDAVFQQAVKIAAGAPKLLYAKASVNVETKRNLDEARRLLERYLASDLTPDDPPPEKARQLLRQIPGS